MDVGKGLNRSSVKVHAIENDSHSKSILWRKFAQNQECVAGVPLCWEKCLRMGRRAYFAPAGRKKAALERGFFAESVNLYQGRQAEQSS